MENIEQFNDGLFRCAFKALQCEIVHQSFKQAEVYMQRKHSARLWESTFNCALLTLARNARFTSAFPQELAGSTITNFLFLNPSKAEEG